MDDAPWGLLPPLAIIESGLLQSGLKIGQPLVEVQVQGWYHVSVSRLRIGVDLKASATILRLLFWAFPKAPVIPLVAGSPRFLVGMWKEDAL